MRIAERATLAFKAACIRAKNPGRTSWVSSVSSASSGQKVHPPMLGQSHFRGIEKATEAPESLVEVIMTPPLLFRLARSSGVASTSAVHPAGWHSVWPRSATVTLLHCAH